MKNDGGKTAGNTGGSDVGRNGGRWTDSAGAPIHAHGGGFLKTEGYYYWFGENRNGDNTFKSVTCYRSTDLVGWDFLGNALSSDSARELNRCNIERPKVIFNRATGKYVMWMHRENGTDYRQARAAVACADTVEGPYRYLGSFRPYEDRGVTDHGLPGYMSRDCTLFADSDGRAYFLSASNENADLHLYRLTADYLSIETLAVKLFTGHSREAPALFRRNGNYFLLTSGCTGWKPNQAKYSVSRSIESGWSPLADVGNASMYDSQPMHVIEIPARTGTAFLYAGDRWAGARNGPYLESGYILLPISFPTDATMSISWSDEAVTAACEEKPEGSEK